MIHLKFVLHPETAQFFNEPKMLALRRKIWEFFTGQPFNMSKSPQPPAPDSPRQMDMHLDLQVTGKIS